MSRPTSIRTRFLLVVLIAAVIPMALIGAWLTRSVVRAGSDLLRAELDESLQKVSGAIAARWTFRRGDLELLANNEVAQRLAATPPETAMTAADSAYLSQLFTSVGSSIPSFEYRDRSGRVRWASPAPARPDSIAAAIQRGLPPPIARTLTFRLPVGARSGTASAGEVVAHLSLAALLPTDTSLRLPNDARLQVVHRSEEPAALLPSFAPDSVLGRPRFTVGGADWLAVHRTLAAPPIDLVLAAPLAAYVQPFERAARTGLLTLLGVALGALLLSAFVTTRLTASLERLAGAADAVAAGDLEHRVDGHGGSELSRVAAAFNSMVDSLRRTLGELSQRQALAAVGEYAATLSHEVRNGLTAIRVDLQRAEEKGEGDAAARPLLTRSLANVKRLDGIVSRSLHLSRSGRVPRRRIDLRAVLARAEQGADSSFHERGASYHKGSVGDSPTWILGDAVALEQLFLNLLLNAAQALERGGEAGISLRVDGADARIVVEDAGRGIAPDDLPRVLDPFFSTRSDGTGLGLPIARQIAVAHGGSLHIESSPGSGTRVEVRLPLAAGPGPAGVQPAEPAQAEAEPDRVSKLIR